MSENDIVKKTSFDKLIRKVNAIQTIDTSKKLTMRQN